MTKITGDNERFVSTIFLIEYKKHTQAGGGGGGGGGLATDVLVVLVFTYVKY